MGLLCPKIMAGMDVPSTTVELRVLNPQDGADHRRGNIKVSKHDVGVVCPGTQARHSDGSRARRTGTQSGRAPGTRADADDHRVQAHMLASIVVEIRSEDLAVELEP